MSQTWQYYMYWCSVECAYVITNCLSLPSPSMQCTWACAKPFWSVVFDCFVDVFVLLILPCLWSYDICHDILVMITDIKIFLFWLSPMEFWLNYGLKLRLFAIWAVTNSPLYAILLFSAPQYSLSSPGQGSAMHSSNGTFTSSAITSDSAPHEQLDSGPTDANANPNFLQNSRHFPEVRFGMLCFTPDNKGLLSSILTHDTRAGAETDKQETVMIVWELYSICLSVSHAEDERTISTTKGRNDLNEIISGFANQFCG